MAYSRPRQLLDPPPPLHPSCNLIPQPAHPDALEGRASPHASPKPPLRAAAMMRGRSPFGSCLGARSPFGPCALASCGAVVGGTDRGGQRQTRMTMNVFTPRVTVNMLLTVPAPERSIKLRGQIFSVSVVL